MTTIDRSGGVVASGSPNMTDRRTGIIAGIAIKAPVTAATTLNVTLFGEQTVDEVACVAGERVLVKEQTAASENGIYDVSTGPWTRAADFDSVDEIVKGTLVFVLNTLTLWEVSSPDPTAIDVSPIAFSSTFSQVVAQIAAEVTSQLAGFTPEVENRNLAYRHEILLRSAVFSTAY